MQGDIWLRVRDSCCHVSREQGAAIIRGLLLSDRFHMFRVSSARAGGQRSGAADETGLFTRLSASSHSL